DACAGTGRAEFATADYGRDPGSRGKLKPEAFRGERESIRGHLGKRKREAGKRDDDVAEGEPAIALSLPRRIEKPSHKAGLQYSSFEIRLFAAFLSNVLHRDHFNCGLGGCA